MILHAATVLILLHAPGGNAILVNPDLIVSMYAAIEGRPNKQLDDAVKCRLNTNDGKFISVVESCEQVQKLFSERARP